MLSNYYTLAVVAADLDARLRGKTIRDSYTQEKNELVLLFDGGSEGLILSCSPKANTLYIHPHPARARTNSVDILKTTIGKPLRSVTIRPMDRVISFSLQDDLILYARFFGSKANVFLVDRDQQIVDAFKDIRTLVGNIYTPSH